MQAFTFIRILVMAVVASQPLTRLLKIAETKTRPLIASGEVVFAPRRYLA